MPISENGVGHSWVTPDKQSGFNAYLSVHMKIVKGVFDRQRKYSWNVDKIYHYIDCNAGDGICQESSNQKGSPLIFLERINDVGLNCRAFFIDIEEGNIKTLSEKIKDDRCKFICGDNRIEVKKIIDSLNEPQKTFGLLYMDPNGIPEFDLIADVASKMKTLDILIRCSATSIKRNKLNRETLLDSISKIKEYKEKLIIREPLESDPFQWTFLFFTNYTDYSAWKKQRFYDASKVDGASILNRLNFTKSDIDKINKKQKIIDDDVKKRSSGICEHCKTNPATEYHHFKYGCLVSESVIHVCHKCHCELEGVSS